MTGFNGNWLTLSCFPKKGPTTLFFGGVASLRHGSETLRVLCTVLLAYNGGIQL